MSVPIFQALPRNASAVAPLATPAQPKPKNPAEAAKQFEALLIAQMLRTAREPEGDSTSETMFDLAGQQFAQMLAGHGGFGLANLIAKGLTPRREGT